jgi:hypothetical protein
MTAPTNKLNVGAMMTKQPYVFLEVGDEQLATDEVWSGLKWVPSSPAFVGHKYQDGMPPIRRALLSASRPTAPAQSGELVGYGKKTQLNAISQNGSALLYSVACPDEDWDVPVYLGTPQPAQTALDMSLEARLADAEADVARLHKDKMDPWMQVHGYAPAQTERALMGKSGEHCINCGASVDPKCGCKHGRELAAHASQEQAIPIAGETWFVKIRDASTLSTIEIIEVSAGTVLVTNPGSHHENRFEISDLKFVERLTAAQ